MAALMEAKPATGRRRIVLARSVGFCYGVRRAIELARQSRTTGEQVHLFGPLVHNRQVIERLRAEGIDSVSSLERRVGTLVLSAHGVTPSVAERARETSARVVDATCPFVTKVHRAACRLYSMGYRVVLLGDPGHSEVVGICGAVAAEGGVVTVVAHAEEAAALRLRGRLGIVSQTTRRVEEFERLVRMLRASRAEVRAVNTICGATDALQVAAREMAAEVDAAIVVGGRDSANTRRLRELCEEAGVPAWQVETAGEIDERWLEGCDVIGITAGASTPDWVIDEVARKLNGGELPVGWVVRHPD